ncbi:MAG: MFS transporter [Polyangiales bacterium]
MTDAPAASADTLRARRTTFALSWLAYASYYLGRKGLSVVKTSLSTALGASTGTLALIDTAFLAAYALGQVPSGVLADRVGARKLIGFGMLGSAFACAWFGASYGTLALVLAFGLNGLSQSTGWPGCTHAMAMHTTVQERGRVMGVWSTCYQLGGVAATALAAFLLARFGWRTVFFGPAAWLALVGGAVLLWLPERIPSAAEPSTSTPHAVAERTTDMREARRTLLHNKALYAYGASYFCIKLIRYTLLFWLPFYLHASAGFDQVQSGYLSTSLDIGGVAGSVGLGYLSDRLGGARSATALCSLLLLALALLFYARLGHAGAVPHFANMALCGVLLFGPDSLLSGAAAQDLGGRHATATAVGIVNGLGSVGALLQGALILFVQQAFGWNALFYVLLGLALAAAACLVPTLASAGDGRTHGTAAPR